jgi:hypothetical protein
LLSGMMTIGTGSVSTADFSLVGRTALAEACSIVTHRCLEDLAQVSAHMGEHERLASVLPSLVLGANTADELMARRFLASLVAVGQKLMDPLPRHLASLAELFAFRLIWREALPRLAASEPEVRLDAVSRGITAERVDLDRLQLLFGPDAERWAADLLPFEEWFEADDERYAVHPYVALTEDQARGGAFDVDEEGLDPSLDDTGDLMLSRQSS